MDPQENGEGDGSVGLLVLEAKSLRPFKTKDEYLDAMKEDLAEWFTCLYREIRISADNFLEVLETGVLLCQHSNEVRKFALEQQKNGNFTMKSNFVNNIQIPQYEVQFRIDVKPGTFLARDNISNFITWTTKMGIPQVLRFETDDLVMRKNERSVVLCLLEVARVGAKFGMLAPTIVQMEEEIDQEIETGEPPPQIKTCDVRSLDQMVRELAGRCCCPVQFPIIKVGDGKYKIGDSQSLVFVRILRKHVMIRVGGGWDTLEHYLDRHDPCRCGFQGHRGGARGPANGRRVSMTAISQSGPTTPRNQRKMSMTSPLPSFNPSQTAQEASGMRSASPGPNKRRQSLTLRTSANTGHSHPSSAATSPAVVNKQPSFSQNSVSKVSTPTTAKKQPQTGIKNSHSSGSVGVTSDAVSQLKSFQKSTSKAPITRRRSSVAICRTTSPVPVIPRSASPGPVLSERLRSQSPVPSNAKNGSSTTRTQSVPASQAQRCNSPIKQITLSDVRSSREQQQTPSYFQQQLQQQQHQQQQQQQQQQKSQKERQQRTLKRQTSVDSANNDVESETNDPDMDSNNPNMTIDKISTMSLGDFKNLLNNALSVPNGDESQCSSDSPRSQSSVDSFKAHQIANKRLAPSSTSASNYRVSNMTKNVSSKIITTPARLKTAVSDCSSSGYSSASAVSDKPRRTEAWSASRSSTLSGSPSTNAASRSINSPRTQTNSPGMVRKSSAGNTRPSSTRSTLLNASSVRSVSSTSSTISSGSTSGYTPRTNATSGCDSATIAQTNTKRSLFAGRSTSNNSLKSYESSNNIPDTSSCHSSQKSDSVETMDDAPSTPSSINSDNSFRNANYSTPESAGYLRSNSYTPNNTDDKTKWDRLSSDNQRANSEPRESVVSDKHNGCDITSTASKPPNVGYVSFAHSDADGDDEMNSELNEIENKMQTTIKEDRTISSSSNQRNINTEPPTPSGRQTPSMIPRPLTPKITRKLSIPLTSENNTFNTKDNKTTGRPPTPRKSNIMIRSPSASSSVRGVENNKEQSYKEIYRKRSLTPGPERKTSSVEMSRRSYTPGPGISNTSSLNKTSATTTRERLSKTMELSKTLPLSIYNDNDTINNNSRDNGSSTASTPQTPNNNKPQVGGERRGITQRKSETVIMVNREEGKHVLAVENDSRPPSNKSKVLARARTEDNRSRAPARNTISTAKRPQSVEPKQLFRRNSSAVLSVAKNGNGVYDRTTEWVQTAVAQNKVHKPKVTPKPAAARIRRAMTPNSFDMRNDEDEEPRTLDEIKAALTLPINGINAINTEQLDAPPEDPEMYATMEKLFHELRQQELKASVNETPGSNISSSGSKSKSNHSKSNSNLTDDDVSLDSNKNVKRKTNSVSTQGSSSVTSPTTQNGMFFGSTSQTPARKPPPSSRTTSTSRVSAHPSTPRSTPSRTTPPRSVTTPLTSQTPPRPSPQSPRVSTHSKPSTPRNSNQQTPSSPRPSSQTTQPPASPRTASQPAKPSSPRVYQPPSPASPRTAQPPRSSSPANVRKQPPRPASTPPRPSTLAVHQSPRSRDDSAKTPERNNKDTVNIITKLKEIMKVNPRKDKGDGIKQKTRIPAPKSLANCGKSKSFSNLSSLTNSMALTHSTHSFDYNMDDREMNGYGLGNDVDDGTALGNYGRAKAFTPLLATPLTTGRSTVIRKESINKNDRLVRAVSVERNMSGLQNNYQYCDEADYV